MRAVLSLPAACLQDGHRLGPSNEIMATTPSIPGQARPERFTILLVEADLPDARLATEWLTHEGAQGPIVLGATSVTEARAVIAACRVDCIVLDLGLPDVSGPEALAEMVKAAPGVPVVVLTARDDDDLDLRLLHLGAADLVKKGGPAQGELLRRTIRYIVELARAEGAPPDPGTGPADLASLRDELEHFAGLFSHDLSGSLNTVTGFLELLVLRAGHLLEARDRQYIEYAAEAATRASTRLAELVADMRQRAQEAAPSGR